MTQYWKNKKSKITWSVDIVDKDMVIIYRNNQSKIITHASLTKNWIKI